MFSDTVTLFCRKEQGGVTTWYPRLITHADFNSAHSTLMSTSGDIPSDAVKLHVRLDGGMIGGWEYTAPKNWNAADDVADIISVKSGNEFDFFMLGEWGGDSVVNDDDYTLGFYNHMNKEYDGVYAVKSVAVYSVIPHIEVIAG